MADDLVRSEEWMSAQGALEGLLRHEKAGSAAHRRAQSELAMCKQSLNRIKEAVEDYEAALGGDDGE